jgi:uncharacterized protein with HEPN domain
MYDRELAIDILKNVIASMEHVIKRSQTIHSSSDFIRDDAGLEKLDSICMQLIATGEGLKQLDKITNGELLASHPDVDWKKAMGMRDIIAHHYFDIDHETVYSVCKERIPELLVAAKSIYNNVLKNN